MHFMRCCPWIRIGMSVSETDRVALAAKSQSYSPSFFIAVTTSVLFLFSFHALLPVLPVYTLNIGADSAGWGVAVTVAAWVATVLRLFGGTFSDRLGRRQVMYAGALAGMAGPALIWATGSYPGLIAGRVFQGIGIGLFTTAYKALIMDLAPPDKRGEALGLGNMSFGFALIAGPPLGEFAYHLAGYGAAFLLCIVAIVPILIALNLISFDTHVPSHQSVIAGAREVLPRRSMQVGIWGMLMIAALFTAIFSFSPLLAEERGISGVGLAFSVYAVMELAGQPLGGWVGDIVGRRLVITTAILTGASGVFCFLAADSRVLMYVGSALIGLGASMARVNIDITVLNGAPAHLRGTATGLQYASIDGWIGTMGWLFGTAAVKSGFNLVYAVLVSILVAGALLMAVIVPRRRAGQSPTSALADPPS
jgi:MFS family permease